MGDRAWTVCLLAIYAIAMALVEAAIVVHLRHLYYAADPQSLFPLRLLSDQDLVLELARELATVLMIVAVAAVSQRNPLRIFAAFVFVFGLWDLAYYGWLKVFLGWPVTWLEWDVLFLIPWAWFGPWLAPAIVACLFAAWGGSVLASDRGGPVSRRAAALFAVGAVVSLVAFLEPAARLLPGGVEAFRGFQPGEFLWVVFLPGVACMAIGLLAMSAGNGPALAARAPKH